MRCVFSWRELLDLCFNCNTILLSIFSFLLTFFGLLDAVVNLADLFDALLVLFDEARPVNFTKQSGNVHEVVLAHLLRIALFVYIFDVIFRRFDVIHLIIIRHISRLVDWARVDLGLKEVLQRHGLHAVILCLGSEHLELVHPLLVNGRVVADDGRQLVFSKLVAEQLEHLRIVLEELPILLLTLVLRIQPQVVVAQLLFNVLVRYSDRRLVTRFRHHGENGRLLPLVESSVAVSHMAHFVRVLFELGWVRHPGRELRLIRNSLYRKHAELHLRMMLRVISIALCIVGDVVSQL